MTRMTLNLSPPLAGSAARGGVTLLCIIMFLCCAACSTNPPAQSASSTHPIDTNAPGQDVTVVIALSSIVPGGIVGHAGLAVGDDYYDFGPQRVKHLQPLKSIRSEAGPWWDDPQQQWAIDRNLDEVLADMPDKVHPTGSLVAIIEAQVTDAQAHAITTFWQDTYLRMHNGEDTYRLTARQCASMVAWSLQVGMAQEQAGDRLPRDLRLMSPTRLYETLSDAMVHTAGPSRGQPADVSLWQLGSDGFEPWQRPALSERLDLPDLPRLRLAIERFKHLPIALLEPQ